MWQEIDQLRIRLKSLRDRIARQDAILSIRPRIFPGKVLSRTGDKDLVQLFNVAGGKTEVLADVYSLSSALTLNTATMVGIDENGARFHLPSPGGLILIEDQGDGTGKQIFIDENGIKSYAEGEEIRAMVVAEPASKFHDQEYPFASGRIYPGVQLTGAIEPFFLVFLAGYGPSLSTAIDFSTPNYSITLAIEHDTAGKIISFSGSWESSTELDTNFYHYLSDSIVEYNDGSVDHQAHFFRKNATKWTLNFYDNYDVGTKIYSNLYFSNTEGGAFLQWLGGTVNFIKYRNGLMTGVTNKENRFKSGDDPYIDEPKKYVEIVEESDNGIFGTATGGGATYLDDINDNFQYSSIQAGDTIVTQDPSRIEIITSVSNSRVNFAVGSAIIAGMTTYVITPQIKTRKGYTNFLGSAVKRKVCPRWILTIGNYYDLYDPATDTTGSGNYLAIDGNFGGSPYYRGFNDEAIAFLIWNEYQVSKGPIPEWGVDADHYTDEVYYKSGHESDGGRIYSPRAASLWWKWNGSSWIRPSPGNVYADLGAGDEWFSKRLCTNSGIGFLLRLI